jgi:hypothetical protein
VGRNVFYAVILTALVSLGTSEARAQGSWWNGAWRFRVPITVDAGAYDRYDKPAELQINFTDLFTAAGAGGALADAALRLIEVDGSGNPVDTSVAFQFDKSSGYDPWTNAAGTLVVMVGGFTPSGSSRTYHLYFDAVGSGVPVTAISQLVTLTDDVFFEGQNSYMVQTPSATYYYHKQGGGFAGLRDQENREWIGYHPTGGSGGSYRGIPNMVFDLTGSSFFHPGFVNSTSSIISQGAVKVTFRTQSAEPLDPWECSWDVYPTYVRMTLLAKGRAGYWFLYEGTPGGSFDGATDFVVRSSGQRIAASDSWESDVASPEWVYFGDAALKRTLYLVNHQDDGILDSYRPQDDLMTVFGFGRDLVNLNGLMSQVPRTFTFGLAEDSAFLPTSRVIASAFRSISASAGAVEVLSVGVPTALVPGDGASGVSGNPVFFWTRVPGATRYHLQVSTDAGMSGSYALNDTMVTDTSRQVAGLLSGTTYYWRVRAAVGGEYGSFSSIWHFTTGQTGPLLWSPLDGARLSTTSVQFVWSNFIGASSYHLQVAEDATFQTGLVVDNPALLDTTATVSGFVPGKQYYWRAGARLGGPTAFSSVRSFSVIPTGVERDPQTPASFYLAQNYPNPFNPTTTIRFGVADRGQVRLEVFSVLGERVATLVDGVFEAGSYSVPFAPGGEIPGTSGVYLYKLSTRTNTIVRKMLFVK